MYKVFTLITVVSHGNSTWLEADYGAESSVLSHRLRVCSSIEGTPEVH